jgi:hypothetical protein
MGHLNGTQHNLPERVSSEYNHDFVADPSFTPRRLLLYAVFSDGYNQPREKDMRSHTKRPKSRKNKKRENVWRIKKIKRKKESL